MPSRLDFDSSRDGSAIPNSKQGFRDFLISKTLRVPNGPQTFTSNNYVYRTQSQYANMDLGDVTTNEKFKLQDGLIATQTANIFKPLQYSVYDNLQLIPRRANLRLYPYFVPIESRSLVGFLTTTNYDTESELGKFAANYITKEKDGPFLSRISQNLYTATAGRVNLLDALNGNTKTAINLITGKEPLIDKNYKITVAKSIPGKIIDFAQTVAGVEFPFPEIPGQYLSDPANPVKYRPEAKTGAGKLLQDVTGVLGSLVGIKRRPKRSSKPSDIMYEHMGAGQKQVLHDNLSYSKYKPDYTTTARSQQSTKLFNFPNAIAQGIKRVIGVEAPKGNAYIGDDRGEDVKYIIADFNGRKVQSSYYLSLLFDPIQTKLFHADKSIVNGGSVGGPLTWVSKNSDKKIRGVYNQEWDSEKSILEKSLSTEYDFREDSILNQTQEILNTMPSDRGEARSHVANVIDQTSRVFREGETMLSRGSAIKFVDKTTGEQSGVEYCRVWTKDRPYRNYSDTMKRTGLIRKFENTVLTKPWNLNIGPMSNGKGSFGTESNIQNGVAKKYMFSIENLAWKTSNKKGFQVQDLPYCERGPNGGRVMWFAPYDLKFSENNSAQWEATKFIGRPEPVYTYLNTERSGQVSFKVVVDHPSILNLLVKKHFEGMSDEDADNYINAFFAGCEELDFYALIRRYYTLEPSDIELIQAYLAYYRDGKTTDDFTKLKITRTGGELVTHNPSTPQTRAPELSLERPQDPAGSPNNADKSFKGRLFFRNDHPKPKDTLYSDADYESQYNAYKDKKSEYIDFLKNGISSIMSLPDNPKKKADRLALFGKETVLPSETGTTLSKLNAGFDELDTNFSKITSVLDEMKKDIEAKKVKSVTLDIQASTSFVADTEYNMKLSFRRAHSVGTFVLNKIKKGGSSKINWNSTTASVVGQQSVKEEVKVSFKDLGYADDISGEFILKFTMLGENATASDCGDGLNCHSLEFYDTKGLKYAAPITFLCRQTTVDLKYQLIEEKDPQLSLEPNPELSLEPDQDPIIERKTPQTVRIDVDKQQIRKKPPLDALKLIVMKALSECYYFQILQESSPIGFSTLKEKLKYFHPAFHSTTPEGLNSRLTFLHQCIRPGDTIPVKGLADENNFDARNSTFGPPPICILRIGDFYHSKIVIRDVQLSFEEGLLDLNPEGIGVQPMIANVTLQISFIGGQGLKEPVARLQNALSFNFFGNTEVYDHRSTATEDRTKFNIQELEKILKETPRAPSIPENSQSPNVPVLGKYIGNSAVSGSTISIDYNTYLVDKTTNVYDLTKEYFDTTKAKYNEILKKYGKLILPVFFSPLYKKKYKMDIYDSISTTTEIELFGETDQNKKITDLLNGFKDALVKKLNSLTSISQFFEFDKFLVDYKLKRSDDIFKPYILSIIENNIKDLESIQLDGIYTNRNKLIDAFDRLNFIMSSNGKDGKRENSDTIVGAQLNSFNPNSFYDRYDNVVDFIKKEHAESFTNDLDTTINFNQIGRAHV